MEERLHKINLDFQLEHKKADYFCFDKALNIPAYVIYFNPACKITELYKKEAIEQIDLFMEDK